MRNIYEDTAAYSIYCRTNSDDISETQNEDKTVASDNLCILTTWSCSNYMLFRKTVHFLKISSQLIHEFLKCFQCHVTLKRSSINDQVQTDRVTMPTCAELAPEIPMAKFLAKLAQPGVTLDNQTKSSSNDSNNASSSTTTASTVT